MILLPISEIRFNTGKDVNDPLKPAEAFKYYWNAEVIYDIPSEQFTQHPPASGVFDAKSDLSISKDVY